MLQPAMVKISLLGLLSFAISLSANIIKTLKNTNIVMHVDPEIISFIKFYLEMPFAIILIIFYNNLRKFIKLNHLFEYIVIFFSIVFTFLTLILLYSEKDPAQIQTYIDTSSRSKWLILLAYNWYLVLFYILGELYPIILYSIFFWQLANAIVTLEESESVYPKIIFCGQVSLPFLMLLMQVLNMHVMKNFSLETGQDLTVLAFILLNFLLSFLIIFLYRTTNNVFANNENIISNTNLSLKIIIKSRILFFIFLQIIFYSSSAIILEVLLMSKIKELIKNYNEFLLLYSKILLYANLFTMLVSTISSKIIKNFHINTLMMLTPILTIFLGTIFIISSSLMKNIELIILIGSLQYICIKSAKYIFFDYTKESLYLSLDKKTRTDGKFSTELLGMKIGKFLGGGLQVIIFTIIPNTKYENILPSLLFFLWLIVILWIFSIHRNKF